MRHGESRYPGLQTRQLARIHLASRTRFWGLFCLFPSRIAARRSLLGGLNIHQLNCGRFAPPRPGVCGIWSSTPMPERVVWGGLTSLGMGFDK